jgi:predicted outer membrane repeat protein
VASENLTTLLQNCTFSGNHAGNQGGAIFLDVIPNGGIGRVELGSSLVWGSCSDLGSETWIGAANQAWIGCSVVDSASVSGEGTIDVDEHSIFVSPGFCVAPQCEDAPTEEGEFLLPPDSPVFDLADSCGIVGADSSLCGSEAIGVIELVSGPLHTRLWPNWPNPFGSRTTIRFDVARQGALTLRVYDVGGRLVRTLAEGWIPAAEHRVIWDGRDGQGRTVGAGVYFLRLSAPEVTETRKLVLIRQ